MPNHGVSLGGVGSSWDRAGGERRLLLKPLFNLLITHTHTDRFLTFQTREESVFTFGGWRAKQWLRIKFKFLTFNDTS